MLRKRNIPPPKPKKGPLCVWDAQGTWGIGNLAQPAQLGGDSLDSNIQLGFNNARLAAQTAAELGRLG